MIELILYIFTGINLLIYLYIIIAVAGKWKVSKAHRRFLFLVVFIFFWIIVRASENIFLGIWSFLIHLDFAVAALVAWQLSLFSIHFPRANNELSLKKELALSIPLIVLSILSFTDIFFIIKDYREIIYYFWYFPYIIILIIYFIFLGAGNFIKKYFRYSGIIKQQLIYIIIGYCIVISILLYDSIYTAVIRQRETNFDILFFNSSILFSAIVAYAMLRYRFMD